MLKIRLQRTGRINLPHYRLIVAEHTEGPKTGKFVDRIGTYNPHTKQRTIDEAKVKHWLSVGAQPSATVHNMLVSAGIINAKKINVLPKYVEPVKEEVPADSTGSPQAEADAEPAAETAEAPAAQEETPAEEPKEEEAPAGETAEEKPAA